MTSSNLTPAILEEAHTAAEYLQWVKGLISGIQEEPDGLKRIRLQMGLVKVLMNEALPIGRLALTYFGGSKQVSIRLKVGSQNYDAMVCDTRKQNSSIQYIEVTLAFDGEDDYLRMRALHEKGEISGLGSVIKNGTQRTGLEIYVEREMISQPEILRREKNRLTLAIKRKLNKQYPPNTLFLIGFDDSIAFDRPDNIANIKATVTEFLPRLVGFHSIVVLGLERGLILSWQTGVQSKLDYNIHIDMN